MTDMLASLPNVFTYLHKADPSEIDIGEAVKDFIVRLHILVTRAQGLTLSQTYLTHFFNKSSKDQGENILLERTRSARHHHSRDWHFT